MVIVGGISGAMRKCLNWQELGVGACLYVVAFETFLRPLGRCILGFGEVFEVFVLLDIDGWY